LHISLGIAAPEALIKIGTAIVGVDSELVLKGMNVISSRTPQLSFEFEFPTLTKAFADLNKK
jgi:NAD dependent epimerase/dehydratase family enzyme